MHACQSQKKKEACMPNVWILLGGRERTRENMMGAKKT